MPTGSQRPPEPSPGHLRELLHRGTPGDVDWYREQCRGVGSILELGCGAGRVLREIAPVTTRVGIDRDHEALVRLGARAPDVMAICADMRDFSFARRFERILIPYNALFALGGHDDARACLASARRHLAPAGAVLLDVYVFDGHWPTEIVGEAPIGFLTSIEDGGTHIDVTERERRGSTPGHFEITYTFHVYGAGEDPVAVVEDTLTHHALSPSELQQCVADAGLRVTHRWRDFRGNPFHEDAERLVLRAEAAV